MVAIRDVGDARRESIVLTRGVEDGEWSWCYCGRRILLNSSKIKSNSKLDSSLDFE